jgi:RNA polymerase sigma factor, sigma-70 family
MDYLDAQFCTGGEDELKETVTRYGAKLLRYATAILCDFQEAEDIVQEVFLAAYQGRATFDGRYLSAWLHKIAYHHCLNRLKQKKRFATFSLRENMVAPEAEDGLSAATLSALQKLKPQERTLIVLRIMEDYSYDELSRLMGVQPAALRKQYERAKRKLALLLKKEQEAHDEAI